jgi:hypothetical protein
VARRVSKSILGTAACSPSRRTVARVVYLGDPVAQGEDQGLEAGVGVELGEDLGYVRADGGDAEVEAFGDLLVAQPGGERREDLALAGRQGFSLPAGSRGRCAARGWRAGPPLWPPAGRRVAPREQAACRVHDLADAAGLVQDTCGVGFDGAR